MLKVASVLPSTAVVAFLGTMLSTRFNWLLATVCLAQQANGSGSIVVPGIGSSERRFSQSVHVSVHRGRVGQDIEEWLSPTEAPRASTLLAQTPLFP